jgi:hypothetical protein
MNRRKVISLSALTAFGFALLTGSAVSQQKSLKDQLVGLGRFNRGTRRTRTVPSFSALVPIRRASMSSPRTADIL